jgi:hypothetical protein
MTKNQIIEKTVKDICEHRGVAKLDLELEEYISATVGVCLPDGDIRTCADFKHLGVECCDTCHGFMPETEMYLIDLLEGDKAWICCAVRSELFPEKKVDESDPRLNLFYWTLSGQDVKDYCGYVPPELVEEMINAGLFGEGNGDAEPGDRGEQ